MCQWQFWPCELGNVVLYMAWQTQGFIFISIGCEPRLNWLADWLNYFSDEVYRKTLVPWLHWVVPYHLTLDDEYIAKTKATALYGVDSNGQHNANIRAEVSEIELYFWPEHACISMFDTFENNFPCSLRLFKNQKPNMFCNMFARKLGAFLL